MREKITRSVAAGWAILLILAYFFLPVINDESYMNNSGRKKLTLEAGEQYSWEWIPESEGVQTLEVRLSGMKKAQGVTLYAEILENNGGTVASVTQPISELGEDGDSVRLSGDFAKGKKYTLMLRAEGEGALKIKGEEDEETEAFFPLLTEIARTRVHNPVLLYFAAGALMISLTPVFATKGEQDSTGREKKEKTSKLTVALPWITFGMIAGLGLLINVFKPMFSFGSIWAGADEEIHWMHVRSMEVMNPGGLRFLAADLITWNPGYVPLAIGYNLARLFRASDAVAYHVAVGCSNMTYALMAALAVKHAPKYKATFLVAATLPTFFFISTCMSYDTVVTGSILLGLSLVLESIDREDRISPQRAIFMVALLAFGSVAKPAYSLALLSLCLLPEKCFESKRKTWVFRLFVVLILIWCVLAMLMPGAYDDVRQGDARFHDTNASEQIAFMLANPIEGGLKPIRHIWDRQVYLATRGISEWMTMGSNETYNSIYLWLLLIVAPLCSVGENWEKRNPLLTLGRRIGMGTIALGSLILLAYAQYIASSPVGGEMQGLQSRYFMPVWIAMALALMWPWKIRKRMGKIGEGLIIPMMITILWVNVQNIVNYMVQTGLM